MFRKVSTLAAFLVIVPVLAWAQNSGKLAGTVVDKTTNDPLPGATVVVDGTQLGTATNANGDYFIIGVPVGKYSVRASFVGFEDLVYEGVEINSGYTRELNFALGEDIEALGELVVEYERPLIQKDAIGVPKIISGEDIANLPVRGIVGVAAIQGGVVADEGSGALNFRGGRDEEVVFFVDGVKVIGNTAVAQAAILEQEMIIGSLPAKYGDAMSGVISISTKGGGSNFFGSLEGITSEVLDDFGYNLVSGSVGGPVIGGLSFFGAVEYQNTSDRDPRAVGPTVLKEDRISFLNANPEVLRFNTADGDVVYSTIPGNIAPDVDTDGDGTPDAVSFERMMEAVGAGADFVLDSAFPINGGEVEDPANFIQVPSIPNRELELLRFNGNLTLDIGRDITIRGTGRYEDSDRTLATTLRLTHPDIALNSSRFRTDSQKTLGFGGSWTHRLSNSTFYQLTADFSTFERFIHSPFFSDDVRDLLFVGDLDHESNAIAARYKLWDGADSVYVQRFKDGTLPNREGLYSSIGQPGAGLSTYQKNDNQQFRIGANATTQVGVHQIEFGGEFEQRTERRYIATSGRGGIESAARFFNDGDVEAGADAGVDSWDQLPYSAIKENIEYYGYNYLGTEEVNDQDIDTFVEGALGDCNDNPGSSKCNAAPYEPVYYAGYIQDKIEYKDLVLNLGLRVDVFDNNTFKLRDTYALIPIVRAGSVSGSPGNIGNDFAVYFNSGGDVIGYRDLDGNFFDGSGQEAKGADITTLGKPAVPDGVSPTISSAVFEDYEPQTTWMPRIGVSFPVTDQALFFAHYDKTSQRPFEVFHDGINEYFLASQGTQRVNNNGLEPTTTTEYELGFRQRVGARSAFTISGFYKSIDNLIQLQTIAFGFPNGYTFYGNSDFGTVKGAQFEFDLRRTNNVAFNANYTLQFANGTGSDNNTATQIAWRGPADGSGFPSALSPLDFDRRHSVNLNLDYRLGKGEGPKVGNTAILQNFGFNVVWSVRSGKPYTRLQGANPAFNSFIQAPAGRLNGDNLVWTNLMNARVDYRFDLTKSLNMTAFLWVQNLFDSDNEVGVYRATGLPDEDGWRSSGEGGDFLSNQEIPANADVLYGIRIGNPFNYGIPRQWRLGLRMNF